MDLSGRARRAALQKRLKITALALAVALLWFGAATLQLARETRFVRATSEQQQQLGEWRARLQYVLTSLGDAETGQRGYLLTGRERYLQPYRAAVAQLPKVLASLYEIAQADPASSALVAEIQAKAPSKLEELAETIKLADGHDYAAAMAVVKTDEGLALMERLRIVIGAVSATLSAEEHRLGDEVVETLAHRQLWAILAAIALLMSIAIATYQVLSLLQAQRDFATTLATSEQRHRVLIEEQTEIIALVRTDGTLTYANPAFGRFFNISVSELNDRNLLESVLPADRAAMQSAINEAGVASEAVAAEARVFAGNGRERWISWRLGARAEAGGQSLVHVIGRDVTQRKTAELALRASEDFLRRTGRVAGIGGWELDLGTGQIIWSSQVRSIHEVADDYVPTLEGFMAFYPQEVRDRLRQAMDDARFRGKPWDLEVAMIPASGHRLFVRSVGEAEFNEQGVPVRLVGTVQDVTDRKRLEHKVEANERFIRSIADNIPVRLAYVNRDKRFQFVNRALFDRMQTSREALIGRSLAEFASPKYREAGSRRVAAVLEGHAQRYEYDDIVEGELRRIETQLIPDRGEVGEVRGFFAIGIDITHLKEVERKLRELTEVFDNTSDFVAQSDAHGNVLYINRSGRRVLDLDEDEPIEGRDFREFYSKGTARQFARDIIPSVKQRGVWVGESEIISGAGRILPVSQIVIGHFDVEGRVSRYSSLMRDISVEVAARRELSRQTATLNTVLEAIPAMVAVFDREMRYMLVNRAFERWRGRRRDELIGRHVSQTMDSAEFAVSEPWAARALAGETVSYEKEYPGATQSKHVSVAYMPLRLDDGSIAGFIGVAHDITRHREENIRLLLLSERDPLTGLLNRAGFEHYMDAKMRQGDGGSLSVIYADLDHFKPVNDTFGHAAGDQLLREFASRLQHLVRPTDAVARLGGDEFVVVLSGVRDISAAARVAEKVVLQAKEPMQIEGQPVTVSASVGVAFDAEAAGGWKLLVERADQLVYRAKAQGRGRAVIAAEPDAPTARQVHSS